MNLLGFYPELLDRARAIDGVRGVTDIAGPSNYGASVAPSDRWLFVSVESIVPTDAAANGRMTKQTVTVRIDLAWQREATNARPGSLSTAGEILAAVKMAFSGWQPKAKAGACFFAPFVERAAGAVYEAGAPNSGFTIYPMAFETSAMLDREAQ